MVGIKFTPSRKDSDISIKYNSKSFIVSLIVSNFLSKFKQMVDITEYPKSIIEIGAGEGYLSAFFAEHFPKSYIISSDVSELEKQTRFNNLKSYNNVKLKIINAKRIPYRNNSFDLVVCSEVLEHIDKPVKAIEELYRITKKYTLLSVPIEPLWSILNMIRCKYWRYLGNTPGHLNRWSVKKFKHLIKSKKFKIVKVALSIPWVIILAKK